tara:strand:+ start:50 stop:355 length:306 start_codon:yes stop_codon:yes gene_type:complete
MSESENALPLDSSFWEHIEHLDFTVGIPVSETRMMDIIQVLRDIYFTIQEDVDEGLELIIAMAAILVASKDGQADKIWEELAVQDAMKNVDKGLRDILNEK